MTSAELVDLVRQHPGLSASELSKRHVQEMSRASLASRLTKLTQRGELYRLPYMGPQGGYVYYASKAHASTSFLGT
jgi:hypothetical protein